jgi:hypothetical protein
MRGYILVPNRKQPERESPGCFWNLILHLIIILCGIGGAVFGLWCMAKAVQMVDHGTGEVAKVAGLLALGLSLPVAAPFVAFLCLMAIPAPEMEIKGWQTVLLFLLGIFLTVVPVSVWAYGVIHRCPWGGMMHFLLIVLPCLVAGACIVGFMIEMWLD